MLLVSSRSPATSCGGRLSPTAESHWRRPAAGISASRRTAQADRESADAAWCCDQHRPEDAGCTVTAHWKPDVSQGNTMEQYTTAVPTLQGVTRVAGSDDGQSGLLPVEEPSLVEILAAIQGSRVALEGKIETVAVEVNLLRADLRKVSDKVKVAEGSIVELQAEVGTLRKQMAQAGSTVGRLEARLEDAEGRSR
ncbi:hypothetical protein NDU88_003575 [Pleurodeles waltl]|uniref:Uncharacterized protein n=1 Tax=Pleurodeles waltl TaxID=8319 RepID=A0AAV7RD97_PLEWA|nr:hypothetical protein NDU88_003575 [Pleurodeles waltl]